jgi:hypothetical protein
MSSFFNNIYFIIIAGAMFGTIQLIIGENQTLRIAMAQ